MTHTSVDGRKILRSTVCLFPAFSSASKAPFSMLSAAIVDNHGRVHLGMIWGLKSYQFASEVLTKRFRCILQNNKNYSALFNDNYITVLHLMHFQFAAVELR
jgi:hypothetical protein